MAATRAEIHGPDDPDTGAVGDRPIYVAGRFVTTSEPVEVLAPGNGRALAVTYHALAAEYEAAVEGAVAAEEPLAALPAYERAAALQLVSRRILERTEELDRLIVDFARAVRVTAR